MMPAIAPSSPLPWVVAAVGVGALVTLHWLRTEPSRRRVAAVIFWREAIGPARPRTLWQRRISHWPTLLLLAAAVVAMAASLARGPAREADAIVIDAGGPTASTLDDGRSELDAAVAIVRADLARWGTPPAVIAAAESPVVLAAPGRSNAIARDALGQLRPDGVASASLPAIALAGQLAPGRIVWYTNREAVPNDVPADVARRVIIRRVATAATSAIAGVQFVADRGDADRGELRVRVAGAAESVVVRAGDRQQSRPVPAPLRAALDAMADESPTGVIAVVDDDVPAPADATAIVHIVRAGPPVSTSAAVEAVGRDVGFEGATAAAGPALPRDGEVIVAAGDAPLMTLDRDRRTLAISAALVDPSAESSRRVALPILLRRLLGELAGVAPASQVVVADQRIVDPANAAPTIVHASAVAREADTLPALATDVAGRSLWPIAALLLLFDAFRVARGRTP